MNELWTWVDGPIGGVGDLVGAATQDTDGGGMYAVQDAVGIEDGAGLSSVTERRPPGLAACGPTLRSRRLPRPRQVTGPTR